MQIQLGNLSEAFGALATFLAVCVALYVSRKETISQMRREERSQAEKISAWPITRDNLPKVVISNKSEEPIFEVVLSYGVAYGAGMAYLTGNDNLLFIRRVPPGESLSDEPRNPGGGMHIQTGIAISFRDAKGRYWRRDATGRLQKTGPTFKELNVIEPVGDWAMLSHYSSN